MGGEYDSCGVCNGDNSTCMCVFYHGYHVTKLDYLLLQYTIDQLLIDMQTVKNSLLITSEDLQFYSLGGDFGALIEYINQFCDECLVDYSMFLDQFIFDLQQWNGLIPESEVYQPQEGTYNFEMPQPINYPEVVLSD